MAEQFYNILTQVGKDSIINASLEGVKIDLTHFALGNGGGSYVTPSESQTQLVNEVWRGTINSVELDPNNASSLTITTIVPADVGNFTIREGGVFNNKGELFAVGKYPETYKPVPEDGSVKDLYIKMVIEVSNASDINLIIDGDNVLASKGDLAEVQDRIDDLDVNASTTRGGMMSATDKAKLDNIELGANKYIHPTSHQASMIIESSTKRFVSDSDKSRWESNTRVVTSATEPLITTGDEWHKEY